MLYRATNIKYIYGTPTPDFLYSYGTGQRYTPLVHAMRTIYAAADPQTAYVEATRFSQSIALKAMPIVATASINCLLENILDVCDPAIQQALNTTTVELTAPYIRAQQRGQPVPTQELSRSVFDGGQFQAIRYPSAQPTGTVCFVVYYDRLISPSFLELIDPEGAFVYRIPAQP